MGEVVRAGAVAYTAIETEWRTDLGEGLDQKLPKHRFLLIRMTIENTGNTEVALPLMQLEDEQGHTYMEEYDLKGVPDSLGLLRILAPAMKLSGVVVFDVPSAAYRLRVSDGGTLEEERAAIIEVPLVFSPPVLDLPQPPVTTSSQR